MSAFKKASHPLEKVKLILIQFRLNKKEWAKHRSLENDLPQGKGKKLKKKKLKKSNQRGHKFLTPTEKTVVLASDAALFKHFSLVDAFYDNTRNHLVQFTFARKESLKISPEFKKVSFKCFAAFNNLRGRTLWETQCYVNPLDDTAEEMIAINCHLPIYVGEGGFFTTENRNSLYAMDGEIGMIAV